MANNNQNESFMVKILTIIVFISLSANAILFIKRGETFPRKKALIALNSKLDNQITKISNELYKYKGISKKVDKAVNDGSAEIAAKEKIISKLIKEKKFDEQISKKLAMQLDSLKDAYLNIIDSLLIEREQNIVINSKIEGLEATIAELNKKVGLGSYLITDNVKVQAVKKVVKDNKQYTALAKKTQEIEVCFDILENKISKAGARKIYFVLTTPNAKVIADGGGEPLIFHHVDYNTTAECSKIEVINYKNKKMHFCTSIKPGNKIETGLYVLEIFTNENKLGMTTFSLK